MDAGINANPPRPPFLEELSERLELQRKISAANLNQLRQLHDRIYGPQPWEGDSPTSDIDKRQLPSGLLDRIMILVGDLDSINMMTSEAIEKLVNLA